jgi:hypothetical protein
MSLFRPSGALSSPGNGKQTIIFDTELRSKFANRLIYCSYCASKQQLLEKAISEKDMALYEMQSEQISESLLQLSAG